MKHPISNLILVIFFTAGLAGAIALDSALMGIVSAFGLSVMAYIYFPKETEGDTQITKDGQELKSMQEDVAQFMHLTGQEVNIKPTELDSDTEKLRSALFREEAGEYETAWFNRDRVEILDALADMLYILLGTANATGRQAVLRPELVELVRKNHPNTINSLLINVYPIHVDYPLAMVYDLARRNNISWSTVLEAFQRVHKSNMSKLCKTQTEAEMTVQEYRQAGTETFWLQRGFHYVVYRIYDQKVLKSINYSPVDLTDLV